MVAELAPSHTEALLAALAQTYDVPEQRVADAIRQPASFGVIHVATMVKVDVFVAHGEADQASLARVGVQWARTRHGPTKRRRRGLADGAELADEVRVALGGRRAIAEAGEPDSIGP